MNKLIKASLPIAIAASLVACGGGSSNDNDTAARMTLDATNLPALGDDFAYEGWIIVDGAPVSTGVFNAVDGEPTTMTADLDLTQANAATTFVLTIEPSPDPDPAPAATHILAGAIGDLANDSRVSAITTASPAAIGSDFVDSTGTFIVATPTNDETTANQGIWFLTPPVAPNGPTPSLQLPKLSDGWAYEGWVVSEDGPISTGVFGTDANAGDVGDIVGISGADSDGGGATAGPNPAPPFPGQDFIEPPINLAGFNAVITVEPVPDNNVAAPFALRPLAGPIPDLSTTTEVNHPLGTSLLGGFPSGTVTIDF